MLVNVVINGSVQFIHQVTHDYECLQCQWQSNNLINALP